MAVWLHETRVSGPCERGGTRVTVCVCVRVCVCVCLGVGCGVHLFIPCTWSTATFGTVRISYVNHTSGPGHYHPKLQIEGIFYHL